MTHSFWEGLVGSPTIEHIKVPDASGVEVGHATLIWEPHPFPFCRVHKVSVHPDAQGHGHGATLIEQINKRILLRSVPAILTNTATTSKPPPPHSLGKQPHKIKDIYRDHGWAYPCGEDEPFMVFNATDKTLYQMLDALEIMNQPYAQRLREQYSDRVL